MIVTLQSANFNFKLKFGYVSSASEFVLRWHTIYIPSAARYYASVYELIQKIFGGDALAIVGDIMVSAHS